LRWSEVDEDAPLRLEVMMREGQQSLGSLALDAGLDESVIRFSLSEAERVEPRVYYGGSGQVTLRRVILTRLAPPTSP